jgi:transcriptional regulator with XRE-family HTH domain
MPSVDPARLKGARENAGLSREEVAIEVGRGYLAVRSWELGQAVPPGNTLVALAVLYGTTVEGLCRDQAPAGAA